MAMSPRITFCSSPGWFEPAPLVLSPEPTAPWWALFSVESPATTASWAVFVAAAVLGLVFWVRARRRKAHASPDYSPTNSEDFDYSGERRDVDLNRLAAAYASPPKSRRDDWHEYAYGT